jgi:hypothetical protein
MLQIGQYCLQTELLTVLQAIVWILIQYSIFNTTTIDLAFNFPELNYTQSAGIGSIE